MMRKRNVYIVSAIAALLTAGCVTPVRVQVSPVGQEPSETIKKYLYGLPRSVLRIELVIEESRTIPGPYWEFAEKYLGIKDVISTPESRWQIRDISVDQHLEIDPDHLYTLNVLEGDVRREILREYTEQGIILDGSETIMESADGHLLPAGWREDYIRYKDLGVYGNFEERIETMYKTIVTDTSFVRVPVDRTIIEEKSPMMKAEEAAEFILDLRIGRYEVLTGEYEVFPNGEAMAAAIERIDRLEESYLSLFTGKTFTRTEKRTYFVIPGSRLTTSKYRLGMFSDQLGFVPDELMEGEPLEVVIEPAGTIANVRASYSQTPDAQIFNKLYYRLPEVVQMTVVLGEQTLFQQRASIFQAGAIISTPLE